MTNLSPETITKLKYYVYILTDPRDNDKPFYVGKGKGSRINSHVDWALEHELDQTDKIKRIREIIAAGKDVGLTVVRHGIESNEEAFLVECSLIDFIGINNLTNIVSGHNSREFGLMSLEDIELRYQAEEVEEITEPMLLIKINNTFDPRANMTDKDILEITRKFWVLDIERVSKIQIVCAVYLGVVRGVYIANKWRFGRDYPKKLDNIDDEDRVYFDGTLAPEDIKSRYYKKSVRKYIKSTQNPVRYINA